MKELYRSRRSVLGALLLGGGAVLGSVLTACTPATRPAGNPPSADPANTSPPTSPTPTPTGGTVTPSSGRTLLAYFSRAGENYYYGDRRDLEVGNTEVLAGIIADLIECDVHRIEAADPYSSSYDATVARNVKEQNDNARPAIANPLDTIDQYDTVLLGSPIWNVRPPMIMKTFAERLDFTGKTVHPFVTFAVSGLGQAERDYAAACAGAQLRQGLAVQGEEVPDHRSDVENWLRAAGLRR